MQLPIDGFQLGGEGVQLRVDGVQLRPVVGDRRVQSTDQTTNAGSALAYDMELFDNASLTQNVAEDRRQSFADVSL